MSNTLPLSNLVSVAVDLTPAGAQAQNLSTLLILGASNVIDVVERYRTYSTLAAVAADFGGSAPEYLAAALWFEQVPQPTSLLIGRWAQAATKGKLVGATLTAAQQALATFTAVTSGGFTYTKNGGSPTIVTGINLSGAANLAGVAALITAALTGTTVTWNSVYARFEFESSTTGSTSSVSFLTAPGSGTDLSPLLHGRASDSGAYLVTGIAAESALAAATLFDANYGQRWYALMIPEGSEADHVAVANYVEATNAKHLYGVTTMAGAALLGADTASLAYQLKQLGLDRTLVVYSSTSAYAVASALARLLTVDWNASLSAITLMFKQLPGIVPENLNASQAQALRDRNANVIAAYDNNTAVFQYGTMSSGEFADTVTDTDWLAVTLQQSLYNLLYTSTTKVPQTDAGTHLMVVTCESVCAQGVVNGVLAPGVWNSGGFGQLAQGDYLPKGYYVYAPPLSSQNPADRAARKSVPLQIAAKLAGAVHEVRVSVSVNQ